jgi:hypothetical protein
VGAGGADRKAPRLGHLLNGGPQGAQLKLHLARVGAGRRGDLAHGLHQLRLDLTGRIGVHEGVQQPLDRVRQVQRLRVDDHQLLLDAERV